MEDIPDGDRVARLCTTQRQISGENNEVIGIQPQFFELRPKRKETDLSCEWVEFYSGDEEEKIKYIKNAVKERTKYKGKKAKIVILDVTSIKNCGLSRGRKIRVQQKKITSSYSGIYGLPKDNSDFELLGELLENTILDIVDYI